MRPRRIPRANRRCRDWFGSVRDTLSPPSCKDIKSRPSAKSLLKPSSSSPIRCESIAAQRALVIESKRFLLYSRPGCGLCEEMLSELKILPCAQGIPIDIVNVDLDPAARARYGHKIPVLMFAGELLCHGRLDPEEVDKTLRLHRRPV